MQAYLIRRVLYAIPVLFCINLLLFLLFFFVNTPDNMAQTILGDKRVSAGQIENWKREHGYHLPRLWNGAEHFPGCLTQTIFWQKSAPLFLFRFGKSDMEGTLIGEELWRRIPYSLCVTVPIFAVSLCIYLALAMIVAFYRGTYVDTGALFLCVGLMSISSMFYILGGQYLLSINWKLVPISGFDRHPLYAWKFLFLPIVIGVLADIGGGVRFYRTIFLEEINKDYIRTARAKGLGEGRVLFGHAFRNAMLPILTNVVVTVPFLIMGSLLLENFFGIPGLGNYTIDAINKQDFAVIRAMVFLGSVLYVGALIVVDLSYGWVDPRVRFK